MDFSLARQTLRSEALTMDYYGVPWDSEILGYPVAGIDHLAVHEPEQADVEFSTFNDWRSREGIRLCSCRVRHDQLLEASFLQRQGFHFIELNYHPEVSGLQQLDLPSDGISIERAGALDRDTLVDIAGQVFEHGRFHQDPKLGAEVGNRRYGIWMKNAFAHPAQTVFQCLEQGRVVGFFVVEYPGESKAYWSLIGLAPGMGGQGLGTRVWQAMMRYHRDEGLQSIQTSISSHNIPILNLYAKLGFRFPLPDVTFHRHFQA